jgi:hypothetical protein
MKLRIAFEIEVKGVKTHVGAVRKIRASIEAPVAKKKLGDTFVDAFDAALANAEKVG